MLYFLSKLSIICLHLMITLFSTVSEMDSCFWSSLSHENGHCYIWVIIDFILLSWFSFIPFYLFMHILKVKLKSHILQQSHFSIILLLKPIFGLHIIFTSILICYWTMCDFPPYMLTLSYWLLENRVQFYIALVFLYQL